MTATAAPVRRRRPRHCPEREYLAFVREGWLITADQLGMMSPYLRGHISRFSVYATDDTRQPEAFNPFLKEVHFTALGRGARTPAKLNSRGAVPLTNMS